MKKERYQLVILAGLLLAQNSMAALDRSRPFISEATFATQPASVFSSGQRDGSEMEVTFKFTCQDQPKVSLEQERKMFQVLSSNNYEKFKKMVKCKDCAAISAGLGTENMPWDKTSHAIRKGLGYLPITIEAERLQPKAPDIFPKLSYGADLMDDIYFDTDEFLAADNNMALRARKRWDSAATTDKPTMRRILVGLKETLPVDPTTGVKSAFKIDDRFDNPSSQQIQTFSSEVPTGFRTSGGSSSPIPSVLRIYRNLAKKNVLPTDGNDKQVLQLKPKTFLRSLRLRFHYGTVSAGYLNTQIQYGRERVADVLKRIQTLDMARFTPEQQKTLAQIKDLATILQNEAEVIKKANLDPNDNTVLPHMLAALPSTPEEIEKSRKVIEVLAKSYADLGALVERNAQLLSQGDESMKEPKWLRKTIATLVPSSMAPLAALPYLKNLTSLTQTPDGITKINQTAEAKKSSGDKDFENFKTLDDQSVKKLIAVLDYKAVDEGSRQIEAVGIAMKAIWFHAYHNNYVGQAFSAGNLFIDTVDLVGMFKAEPIEVDEFNPDKPSDPPVRKVIDFDKLNNNHLITANSIQKSLIGTYLSNDVQLELGYEVPYDTSKMTNPTPEKLAAIKWITGEIQKFQKNAARLKAISINDFIDKKDTEKAGCSSFQWKPTDLPKGESSLQKLKELERK